MKNYFKRTKMMDEAKLQSKPRRPFGEALMFFLLYYISSFAQGIFIYPAVFVFMTKSQDITTLIGEGNINSDKILSLWDKIISGNFDWIILVSLFSMYAVIVVVLLYCRFFEKRSFASMGLRKGNVITELSVGFIIGAVMLSCVIAIGTIIGAFEFNGFSHSKYWIVIFYLFGCIIQGFAEELLVHGYFMTSLSRSVPPIRALVLSSLMYVLIYSGRSGLSMISYINMFLFAVVLGIYIIKRGNIWGACTIHSAWNFFISIIFVVSSSGDSSNSALVSFTSNGGLEKVTGGIYGIENGLLVTLVLFVFLGVVLKMKQNEKEISNVIIIELPKKEGENNEGV